MSTFLRKTARIFASDLDLGFMTWQSVLKGALRKAFSIELHSCLVVRDVEDTWRAEALEGGIGGRPNSQPYSSLYGEAILISHASVHL